MKAKATKSLNLIKMLSSHSFGSNRTLLLKIHQSIVLPILDYGSIDYATANKNIINSLNSVHHSGVRISTGAFKTSKIISLLVDAGLNDNELNDSTNLAKYRNRTLRYQPFVARAFIAHEKYDIPRSKTDLHKFHKYTPWTLNIYTDTTISSYSKNTTASTTYRQLFRQNHEQYQEHYKIYTDGSKKDEKSGCAFVTSQFSSKYHLPDHSSIFTAELYAILKAINHCKSLVSNHFFCTDSLSYTINKKHLLQASSSSKNS